MEIVKASLSDFRKEFSESKLRLILDLNTIANEVKGKLQGK